MNDPEGYCREVEAYLCRKNDGHLIRIVGPAFEQVCGWSTRGVPLKAVFSGIDRYFERYYAKGPRRRPVRVEFCEADVLDVFDEWRRAVGVSATGTAPNAEPKKNSLPDHLERVIARLTVLVGATHASPLQTVAANASLRAVIDDMVRELDGARTRAKSLRGGARAEFLERLRALDTALTAAARAACGADELQRLGVEADVELAPFRARMPGETYERSRQACIDRLVREKYRLPVIAFD